MLFKFDVEKLRTEVYWVKSLTTALGGAVSVVDEARSTPTREVYKRIPVPMSVVRAFKVTHKTTKYIRPCLIGITYYENQAIALERHPAGCLGERFSVGLDGEMKEWRPPNSEYSISKVRSLMKETKHEWYFDGRYMFALNGNMDDEVRKATFLTKDGRFRVLTVNAIGLHEIPNTAKVHVAERSCLVYVASNGAYAISPPIWKDAGTVGASKIRGVVNEEAERSVNFDLVDQYCAVNVSFALNAAAKLSQEFGFEAIEPLNLPSLMVKMNTVNLPKIPNEVKATFDSGIKFTHALAWLLGFARRAKTLETYLTIRSLIKYLTSKGLFHRDVYNADNVFASGQSLETIPLLTKEEALAHANNMTIEEQIEVWQLTMPQRRNNSESALASSGFYDDNVDTDI